MSDLAFHFLSHLHGSTAIEQYPNGWAALGLQQRGNALYRRGYGMESLNLHISFLTLSRWAGCLFFCAAGIGKRLTRLVDGIDALRPPCMDGVGVLIAMGLHIPAMSK
jgi:hypothetical protein